MSFLTFNTELSGGGRFSCLPSQESQEDDAALREPMPLKTPWALWEQLSTGSYSTRKVKSFTTAQDFWMVWNGVPQPSELLDNKRFFRERGGSQPDSIDAVMVFRDGIHPSWEDSANANGGHFMILLKPSSIAGPGQIDEYWNNLVLAAIGETMESSQHITGVRLVDKLSGKGKSTDSIRLELWYHSDASGGEVAMLRRSMEKTLMTRLDGSQGSPFKSDAIQDKKHSDKK